MAFALSEIANKNYGLFGPMFDGQFTFPVTIFRGDELTKITVPEVLETKPDAHIVIRGASVQLIALLELGDLDHAFEYESVIQQHGLKMVSLPAEVNLGEQGFAELYNQVQVNLDFQRFASIQPGVSRRTHWLRSHHSGRRTTQKKPRSSSLFCSAPKVKA